MDTILVAIASIGAITVLSAVVSGLAAYGRRLGTRTRPGVPAEAVTEVANAA